MLTTPHWVPVGRLEVKLNSDMAKVNKWCKDNKMAINCDKTKVMLITTYQKEAKLDSLFVILYLHYTCTFKTTLLKKFNLCIKIQ